MKLALYRVPSKPMIMRMPDRKCPCCLAETPSFIIGLPRKHIRKAQEKDEKMSDENKTRIQEDEKKIEKKEEEFGEKQRAPEAKEDKTGSKSFAEGDNQNIPQRENEKFEDLSMFERDLRLPDEGSMCIDSNLQAAKYMIIYLMKRVYKGINTWWKFNITTPRKEKLKLWEQGM